ncbi:TetR/AcrR family transcriptional regulator [uncultured Paraglaciecola sp.]|uniref:TetR/AcrR family transcriptional regulator n=1 Tax=uncultured Paraglaciecola sp. TaxID=1765024 RepID=UPI0025913A97|nr:TetR/AcrR family transcriptional regulator [uncultured Paraglaciecola sp.]
MLKSTQKIFDTAKECFFLHGYSATSIAMISRYSGVSRVTIHKQFSSKEVLFRATLENYLLDKDTEIQEYTNKTGLFWNDTYEFLARRCTEVFDNIPNAMIKSDLILAGHSYCQDLLEQSRIKTRRAIQIRLQRATDDGQLSLKKIGLDCETLATNIELLAEGIMLSSSAADPNQVVKTTLHVYEVSCII